MNDKTVPYKVIPSSPEQLLLVYHTDTEYGRAQIWRDFQFRSNDALPSIRFERSARNRIAYAPMAPNGAQNIQDTETVTTKGHISEFINYAGPLFLSAPTGLCGIDLITHVSGTVTFPGYIHVKDGDININVPADSDIEVISQAKEGVFYNNRRTHRPQHVDPFDEYILEQKLSEPTKLELLAKVKRSSYWVSFIDTIRQKGRLYLLADNGRVDIQFEERFRLPSSRRDRSHDLG